MGGGGEQPEPRGAHLLDDGRRHLGRVFGGIRAARTALIGGVATLGWRLGTLGLVAVRGRRAVCQLRGELSNVCHRGLGALRQGGVRGRVTGRAQRRQRRPRCSIGATAPCTQRS